MESTTEQRHEITVPPSFNGAELYRDEPTVRLADYGAVLWRYRFMMLAVVVLGMAAAAGVLMIYPHTYISKATLLPPDKGGSVSLSALVQAGQGFDLSAFGQNQSAEVLAKMLESRTVADSLVTRFGLLQQYNISPAERQLAIDQVQSQMAVESDHIGVIDIVFQVKTGWSPDDADDRAAAQQAAGFTNASIDLLDGLIRRKMVTSARRAREFLDVQVARQRVLLDSLQAALEQFQRRNKVIELDKQTEASVSALFEVESQISKLEVDIARAGVDVQEDTRAVEALRQQLAVLKRRRNDIEAGRIGGGSVGYALSSVPSLARQYAQLKLDVKVSTELYGYLVAEHGKEQIQEARDLPVVQVLDPGAVAPRRAAPRRTFTLIIVGLVLVIGSCLLAFILDSFRRRSLVRERALGAAPGP